MRAQLLSNPSGHAACASGIRFDRWSTRPGFASYFHPFASMLDNLTMHRFTDNVHARLNRADGHGQPDRFLIATRLAQACKAPKAQFGTEPRTQSVRTRVG